MERLQTNNKMANEAITLLLKKANLTKKDITDVALRMWASQNLDLFNATERKHYKSFILGDNIK